MPFLRADRGGRCRQVAAGVVKSELWLNAGWEARRISPGETGSRL